MFNIGYTHQCVTLRVLLNVISYGRGFCRSEQTLFHYASSTKHVNLKTVTFLNTISNTLSPFTNDFSFFLEMVSLAEH